MSILNLIVLPGVTSALTVHVFDYFSCSKHEINEKESEISVVSIQESSANALEVLSVCSF